MAEFVCAVCSKDLLHSPPQSLYRWDSPSDERVFCSLSCFVLSKSLNDTVKFYPKEDKMGMTCLHREGGVHSFKYAATCEFCGEVDIADNDKLNSLHNIGALALHWQTIDSAPKDRVVVIGRWCGRANDFLVSRAKWDREKWWVAGSHTYLDPQVWRDDIGEPKHLRPK